MESVGVEDKIRTLSNTLQNLVNDMNDKLNKFKQDFSIAIKEIQELKEETGKIKNQMKDVKTIEWEARNKNIIIFGLKEHNNESKIETRNRIMNLFSDVLKLNCNDQQIDNLFWLGRRKQNRPLLVKLTSSIMKEYILKKKGNVRKMENQSPGRFQPRNLRHKKKASRIHVDRKEKRQARYTFTRPTFD